MDKIKPINFARMVINFRSFICIVSLSLFLNACSNHNNDQNPLTKQDSLSLRFDSIISLDLENLVYKTSLYKDSLTSFDQLDLRINTANKSEKSTALFIDNTKHPLLAKLEIYNANDSNLVQEKWANLSSKNKLITDQYLDDLESSKLLLGQNHQIGSFHIISEIVKLKGPQKLDPGTYRLVIGDKNDYTDTLSFVILSK